MLKKKEKKLRDLTQIKTPHTYAIIFLVVLVLWVLTFLIPAGRFSTHSVDFQDANGKTKTKTVLMPQTFRYLYNLDMPKLQVELIKLETNDTKLSELSIDKIKLDELVKSDVTTWDQSKLDEIGLTDAVIYDLYKNSVFDTSKKLHKIAKIWGTDDFYGFGVLNYVFEGLVTGDKTGSAVGIVALILVVGGSFGIIMRTGAIDAGIYAFISRTKGFERFSLPLLFFVFAFGGASFGMSEECIPFAMVMVPLVIAMGYDSIVAVTVTFVASQIGNATSWMNPFGIVIAQGIAGIPVLSGMTFRIIMFLIMTLAGAAYMMYYAEKIRKKPELSIMFFADNYFRNKMNLSTQEKKEFKLGHKLILLNMLAVLIWLVWGVVEKSYYIPEIASQFFVMGFVSGVIAVIFKLNGMGINEMAASFQQGVADLAGTAVVVGMAKGILLVLGGSGAAIPTTLNTILHSIGVALTGFPSVITAWFMYVFQSVFNVFVSSNSGQAALTMPIMSPLADIVGVSKQVACLAYQLGSGFVDAITPTSASLIGVLGVARIDWVKWFKFQIKMQGFLFSLGSIFIIVAVIINLQ
jgi:uncharacterized ion transporter superfamily protein YfcC